MAFPDDLHLAGIVDKIQFKHPKGHGIIDLRLIFYAENGENPFVSDPFCHIPILYQRRPASLLRHSEIGGLLSV
jgi:hypothetical protein